LLSINMAKTEKRKKSKFILWFWGGILLISLCSVLFFYLISLNVFGPLPKVEELENPKNNLATDIISSDGKSIGKFFYENRTNVKFEDLSPHLVNALIATEDERYYKHSGIDFRSLIRAVAH